MSIEKAIADQTAAIEKNTAAIQALIAAYQAGAAAPAGTSGETKGAKNTGTKNTGKNDADKDNADDGSDDGAADPIYWHIPGTEEFGTVDTEAEWKKLKKAKAKAVKIPESKYQTLVEAASKTDDDDTTEYSDRILALIDDVPEEPEESDITELFKKYLPKDLDKSERDARAALIKPVLEGVGAPKATAVKEDDRRAVMIAVIKSVETHLEETDQVSEEDDGLV